MAAPLERERPQEGAVTPTAALPEPNVPQIATLVAGASVASPARDESDFPEGAALAVFGGDVALAARIDAHKEHEHDQQCQERELIHVQSLPGVEQTIGTSALVGIRPVAQAREEAILGSLTGYCPSSAKDAEFLAGEVTDVGPLLGAYSLRSELRPVAADDRIRKCGTRVYTDPTIITEEYEDGSRSARWTGIALCNRAGCPVCGAVKARKFGRRVLRTLGSGGTWQHVILTVPHSSEDSWSDVYERLLDGVRDLSHSSSGRIVMGLVQASIRAAETTYSWRSGWHVHLHLLWKVSRPLLPEEQWVVACQWSEATGADVVHGCRFGASFNCEDSYERQNAANYISKLALEMSGACKSAHPEHWSLGELFHQAALSDEYVPLVQEYQRETKGKRIYQLDRRATLLHDAAPELPERIVVESWITVVDRLEFRGLSRAERFGRDPLATYLPLEVAIRARGDPRSMVEDTIYDVLRDSGVR